MKNLEKESCGADQFQFVPSRDTEEENCGENKQLESDCLDTVGMLYRCRKNGIDSVQGISCN